MASAGWLAFSFSEGIEARGKDADSRTGVEGKKNPPRPHPPIATCGATRAYTV